MYIDRLTGKSPRIGEDDGSRQSLMRVDAAKFEDQVAAGIDRGRWHRSWITAAHAKV